MELDGDEILDRLLALPIATWEYDTQPGVTHLGPMAQDFAAAFGLGDSDLTIGIVDYLGVLAVSIQALARRMEALHGTVACSRCAPRGERRT